jgi:hypothetical protein
MRVHVPYSGISRRRPDDLDVVLPGRRHDSAHVELPGGRSVPVDRDASRTDEVGETAGRGHRDQPRLLSSDPERVRLTSRQIDRPAGIDLMDVAARPSGDAAFEHVEDFCFRIVNVQVG